MHVKDGGRKKVPSSYLPKFPIINHGGGGEEEGRREAVLGEEERERRKKEPGDKAVADLRETARGICIAIVAQPAARHSADRASAVQRVPFKFRC